MPMDLRPLTLGELLDRSFSLYRAHFRTFVAIMALPAAFAAAFGLLVQLFPAVTQLAAAGGEAIDADALVLLAGLTAGMLLMLLLYTVAYTIALGATTAAVSELYMGRAASAASAYGHVRGRIGRLILLMLQIGLRLTAVAIAAFVVVVSLAMFFRMFGPVLGPALGVLVGVLIVMATALATGVMALRYALSVAAVVLEPITARQAISRSIELTRGSLGRVLALVVFAVIIAYITAALFQGPFVVAAAMAGPDTTMALGLNLIGALTGAVAGAISGPIMIVALALLYYDARVRHEGLDLQLMMQMLDAAPAIPIAPHPPAVLPG